MKIIALILAAGSGQRFESNIPKQYSNHILRNTINKFLNATKVIDIQVVIRPEDENIYQEQLSDLPLLPVTFGGLSRTISVAKGLESIEKYAPDLVLIHDACRPYLSTNLINEIISKLKNNKNYAIIPTCLINDTVRRINNDLVETVDRTNLYSIQTPQGFYYKQILPLYQNNQEVYSDDSSIAIKGEIPIIYISGEPENIKITIKQDIKKMLYKSGLGFDVHEFSKEEDSKNLIILGGVAIPYSKKIIAHSDGDVLIHALVDAILGALAVGDIGQYFPPSDPKWKNVSSVVFLKFAKEIIEKSSYKINNIDLILIAEQPKISDFRYKIVANIANILDLNHDQVNLKATTTENLGFIGRREGIAAQALVTIEKI